MGKKLTTWEKSRRESEKNAKAAASKAKKTRERSRREREIEEKAAASRAETAARRAKERQQKEKLSDLQTDLGNAIVSLFNNFMKQLVNLTLAVDIKKISAQDHLDLPKSISFKYPGDLTHSDIESSINRESFNPNKATAKSKENMNLKYESYRSHYGSFFGNLFGKTKKEYESFIKQAQIDFNLKTEEDGKRKNDFAEALRNYEEGLVIFNKKAKEELSIVNKKRLNQFDHIQSEVKTFNSSLVSTKKEIDEVLVTADIFDSLFGLSLPISFTDLDSTFDELSNLVKEFKKDSFESPSINLKYGLSISNEKLHLFLVYKDTYFPLPFEKQINSTKSGYSIQQLTKANREKIDKNLIPGAALLYAVYAFNTSKGVKDLILSIGKETVDKKTGSDLMEWETTISIEKSKLMSLTFENIEPVETLSVFSPLNAEPFTSKIKWYNKKQKVDQFNLKLQKINRLHDNLTQLVNDFKKENFSLEIPEDLKKLMKRVIELKG
jgi:hypothetical protein